MSTQYPGGFITKSPVAPTSSAASGIWTVDQALQYVKAGTWPAQPVNYIEDMFSTYLYTGNSSTQTITNNIDLSTNGGLVWIKSRTNAYNHVLTDTVRGVNSQLQSNTTAVPETATDQLTAFSTTGFTVGAGARVNETSSTLTSWTFREQPKFFDIVTYTGTGANRTISHNLGSVPGCIMVKRTDTDANWEVYHRSLTSAAYSIQLNLTNAQAIPSPSVWNSTAPTSTVFSLGTSNNVNASAGTYIAYLFAHDAGGFGLTGADNVISCGSYTGTGADLSVNLGYEPQWLLVKRASSGTQNWGLYDNMRGMFVNYDDQLLQPNVADAEVQVSRLRPTATGFDVASGYSASGVTFIYIAIRRGPMKVPTVGTSVFTPLTYTGTSSQATRTPGISSDLFMSGIRADATGLSLGGFVMADKLRGWGTVAGASTVLLGPYSTSSEQIRGQIINGVSEQNSITLGSDNSASPFNYSVNYSGSNYIEYFFRRAPSFFDEVCYTGTAVNNTARNHNLGVVPELIIFKDRSVISNWPVYCKFLNNQSSQNNWNLRLNTTAAQDNNAAIFGNQLPTASLFYTGGNIQDVNFSGENYVAYLFATCAGVSKVGSYTGTAALQTVACGFTSGARFVLIKRTDSTGDWYVWDSARGISSSTDPYLLLNSTAAEVTGTNYVDTDTTGFKVTAAASTTVNISAASYIFLAIA